MRGVGAQMMKSTKHVFNVAWLAVLLTGVPALAYYLPEWLFDPQEVAKRSDIIVVKEENGHFRPMTGQCDPWDSVRVLLSSENWDALEAYLAGAPKRGDTVVGCRTRKVQR